MIAPAARCLDRPAPPYPRPLSSPRRGGLHRPEPEGAGCHVSLVLNSPRPLALAGRHAPETESKYTCDAPLSSVASSCPKHHPK